MVTKKEVGLRLGAVAGALGGLLVGGNGRVEPTPTDYSLSARNPLTRFLDAQPVFAQQPTEEVRAVRGEVRIDRILGAGQMVVLRGTVSRLGTCETSYETVGRPLVWVGIANKDNTRWQATLHQGSHVVVETLDTGELDYDTQAALAAEATFTRVQDIFRRDPSDPDRVRGAAVVLLNEIGMPPCEEVDDWWFNRRMRMAPPPTPEAPVAPAPAAPQPGISPKVETAGILWGSEDHFNTLDGKEVPMGDAASWMLVTGWDGEDPNSTFQLRVAPGMVVRVKGVIGTDWHVWGGPDTPRWDQMNQEVLKRDQVNPTVITVTSPADASLVAGRGWTIQPFPRT